MTIFITNLESTNALFWALQSSYIDAVCDAFQFETTDSCIHSLLVQCFRALVGFQLAEETLLCLVHTNV